MTSDKIYMMANKETTKELLVVIGSGGHAVVAADVAIRVGYSLYGFYDDNPNAQWNGMSFVCYGVC